MEGYGEKSYINLIQSIEKSKEASLPNFILSLGILNVGLSNAKLLCKHYQYELDAILEATEEELIAIEGYGAVIAKSLVDYFGNEDNRQVIHDLLHYISFQQVEVGNEELVLEGKTFVITGSLEIHDNRKALKERIESLGGKVTGSVTSKTDYLINNNTESTSSKKNKKAKDLGIPIINEETFLELVTS